MKTDPIPASTCRDRDVYLRSNLLRFCGTSKESRSHNVRPNELAGEVAATKTKGDFSNPTET